MSCEEEETTSDGDSAVFANEDHVPPSPCLFLLFRKTAEIISSRLSEVIKFINEMPVVEKVSLPVCYLCN
jgi:hypothetical protein